LFTALGGVAAAGSPLATVQIPTPATQRPRTSPISVALSGGVLVIGDTATSSAYVFTSSGSTFSLQGTIHPSVAGSFFGEAVAVSGNRIAVGQQVDANSAGAVYVFEQVQGSWTQTARLTASDSANADSFGHAVALSGDRLVVGAPGIAQSSGAAY